MSPRPQIDHIRKPQLLSAAAEVISERGVEATRIADVAERAGTSPPAVLYWFDSRDELLGEALTFAEDGFYERFSERLAGLADPRDRLLALIDASVTGEDWVLCATSACARRASASTTAGARRSRRSSRRGSRPACSPVSTPTGRRSSWHP